MTAETLTMYSEGDIIKNSNRVRELVVDDMLTEGIISEEVAERYLGTRVIVGYKPSWFGKTWRKIQGKEDKDNFYLTIVEIDKEEER